MAIATFIGGLAVITGLALRYPTVMTEGTQIKRIGM
jgi:hypothetical protein